ncbi:MAG: hypothetical protein LW817_07075 [Candidatus Caenarcaniphilales bacterium]|jgi:hypothetical protein|nr:hypothetical protein [Candidatus Caenarcaniphilales bacterium]
MFCGLSITNGHYGMRHRIIKFIVILICIFGLAKSGQATFLPLTVQELDGSPSISKVKNITFNGATLSDLLNGRVMVTVSSTTSSAGSTGAIQFNNNNALAADSSNLFWDDTNNRLGLGTNNPGYPLQIGSGTAVTNSSNLTVYPNNLINSGFSTRITVAGANNYQDMIFEKTNAVSTMRSWSFGNRYDTHFGNSAGSFQIVGAHTDGFLRTPLIAQPNGDLILVGASNAINGNIGVGTSTPARKLHISEAMRIQPQSSPPSSPALGDLYVDSDTNSLCFYNGSAWIALTGGGCS